MLPAVVAQVPLAHRVRLRGARALHELRQQRLGEWQRVVVVVGEHARLEAVPDVVPAREERRTRRAARPLDVEVAELHPVVRLGG